MDAAGLIKALSRFGYSVTRQSGSHIRLTTNSPGQHHMTIPNHSPIKLGTLNAIINEVAASQQLSRDELMRHLFE